MFTNSLYTYNNTYYICSSTAISLILILINNLHTVRNSEILFVVLLNVCSLATFTFDLILGQETTAITSTLSLAANNT